MVLLKSNEMPSSEEGSSISEESEVLFVMGGDVCVGTGFGKFVMGGDVCVGTSCGKDWGLSLCLSWMVACGLMSGL